MSLSLKVTGRCHPSLRHETPHQDIYPTLYCWFVLEFYGTFQLAGYVVPRQRWEWSIRSVSLFVAGRLVYNVPFYLFAGV